MSSAPPPPPQGRKPSKMSPNAGQPLTCYFWYTEGRCHKSEAECQYAHWATGLTAPPPAAKGKGKGKGPTLAPAAQIPAPAPFPSRLPISAPFAALQLPPAPAPLPVPFVPFIPYHNNATAALALNQQAEREQRLQAWETSLAARELSLHDWEARLGNQAATFHEWEARLNARQAAATAGTDPSSSAASGNSGVGKVLERVYNVLADAKTASAVAHGELTGKFKELSHHQAGSEQAASSMMVGMAIAEAAGMLGRFEGRLVGLEHIISAEMRKMGGGGETIGAEDENAGKSASHGGWT